MSILLKSLKQCNIQYLPSIYHINVRYATKPRWVPIGKTKVFRVNQRVILPPDEEAEMKRLNKIYRTRMKSIKHFFEEVYRANETSEEVIQKFEQEKEDDWRKCMELNDKWNHQIAVERAQRDTEALENAMQAAREKIELENEFERKRLEELEETIRQEKEASKYHVTEDNIDETIERILSSPPHTFNFAIDKEGRRYSGLSSTPDIDAESEQTSIKSKKVSSSVSD